MVFSTCSVWLQLKHYYKPFLQRYVVRILILCVDAYHAALVLYRSDNITLLTTIGRDD